MAAVTLEKISKVYGGDVHAVCDLALQIREGEFLVLVGPSGCGKTTTLRMIAGLESITAGTLKIDDRVVNDVPPRERDIAMVFQNFALYPHLTIEQNLSFALNMRKTPKAETQQRVEWVADLLGLQGLLTRKPQALSGGQRQRVALGRAIVRKPAVFLFDEPLSNLDAQLRVETRAEIKRLHRQLNTTTLYVTHDQEEAMTLGDRVVVMQEGRLRQCDSPLAVYQRPADRFVAGFLGMPPMNFLTGHLQQIDDKLWFVNSDAKLCLSRSPAELLAGESKREVVAGIRPESFSIEQPTPANASTAAIQATVQFVEPLGSTIDVSLETASGHRLVCRGLIAPLEEGQEVSAVVKPQDIHLFEPDESGFGRRL